MTRLSLRLLILCLLGLLANSACDDMPTQSRKQKPPVYKTPTLDYPRGDSTFLYYYNRKDQHLYRKPLTGGPTEKLGPGWPPAITPDGRRLAFRALGGGLWVHDFPTDSTWMVTPGDIIDIAWMGDSLLYTEWASGIWLATIAGHRRHLAAPYEDNVFPSDPTTSGSEICYMGHEGLRILDLQTGTDSLVLAVHETYAYPSLSPDGTKIVFYSYDDYSVRVWDRLTASFVLTIPHASDPGFTADGHILYVNASMDEKANSQIWIADTDGTNQRQLTFWEDHH